VTLGSISGGACAEAFFNIEVARNASAYNSSRRYVITATDSGSGVSATSPVPRQIFVERLVSQNRNSTTSILVNGTAIPGGGIQDLLPGGTYSITLNSATSTQGYEQLETFLGLPNSVFQVQSVSTTYSANTSPYIEDPPLGGATHPQLYADACLWDADPSSPNYRSCLAGSFKSGGTNSTTYTVKIIGGEGQTFDLFPMLYDFSGSSYHYNSDFSTSARRVRIVAAASMSMTKSFNPKAVAPGGESTLSFSITNPNSVPVSGVNFTDPLPSGMSVATTPTIGYTGCGAGSFSPTPVNGTTTLSFSGGTVGANGTCTISIKVKTEAVTEKTYSNTTTNLLINGVTDTGSVGSDSLITKAAAVCTEGQTMASWTVPSTATNPPDKTGGLPTTKSTQVGTATLAATQTASTGITTSRGSGDTYSWSTYGYKSDGQSIVFTVDTSKFSKVQLSFALNNPGTSNGPTSVDVSFDKDGAGTGVGYVSALTISNPVDVFTTHTVDLTNKTNASGNTFIKLTGSGAKVEGVGGALEYDSMTLTGCAEPVPAPTITKSFSPTTIAAGSTSTLSFTISNTTVGNVALSGISINDVIPVGLSITDGTQSVCGGTNNLTRTASSRTIAVTGGSLAAGGSCTFSVTVTGVDQGAWNNVTGFVSTTENGTTGSTASASVTVVEPPQLVKSFAPSAILKNGSSTLTFTITNPNSGSSLSGLTFTDVLPTGVTITDGTQSVCGGTDNLTRTASSRTIAVSGGSLSAGATCEFAVTVSGTTAGTKNNETSTISSTEGGSGPKATADLLVTDPIISVDLSKQVAVSGTGPWRSSLPVVVDQQIYYRFIVTNSGEVSLSNASIADPADPDLVTPCSLSTVTLAPGESAECVVGPVSAVSGTRTNTAVATATGPSGTVTSNSTSATTKSSALTLDKTSSSAVYTHAGQSISYSYKVTNSGFSSLSGPVTVADDRATVSCPSLSTIGDGGNFFDPGEEMTCTATYMVQAGDIPATLTPTTYLVNIATASAGGITSNSDSVSLAYDPSADISVTKSDGLSAVEYGQTTTYEITVTNNGPSMVTGVKLTDVIPAALTNVSVSCSATPGLCTSENVPDAAELAGGYTLPPSFADDQFYSINITATVPMSGVSVSNTASVVNPVGVSDPDTSNNSQTDTNQIAAKAADLEVTKTDNDSAVFPGDTSSYEIVVTNFGPSSVTNAVLTDDIPTSLGSPTIVCGTPAGLCTSEYLPTQAQLKAGYPIPVALGVNDTYRLRITGVVEAISGTVVNTVSIAAPADITESTLENNTATDTNTVTPRADLSVTKTPVGSAPVSVGNGGTASYELVVSNAGPSTVTGAKLIDTPGTGFTISGVACKTSQPTAPESGAKERCWNDLFDEDASVDVTALTGSGFTAPTLQSGDTFTIIVSGTVNLSAAAGGSIDNSATVTSSIADPTPGNNTDSAENTITVTPRADLSVTKTPVGSAPVSVGNGGTASYELVVSNAGPSTVADAKLVDVPSEGLTVTGIACETAQSAPLDDSVTERCVGTFSGTQVANFLDADTKLAIPTLRSGDTFTIIVSGSVSIPSSSGSVNNSATVSSPTTDPTPGNNTDSAGNTITVTPATDLKIEKTDGESKSSVTDGSSTTYTVTVTNLGPSSVTGAVVKDPAVPGLSVTSVACAPPPLAVGEKCDGSASPSLAPTASALQSADGYTLSVALAKDETYTFTVTATVGVANTVNTVANTATVYPPEGTTDLVPGNNSATDTNDVPQADLKIEKTDGVTTMTDGSSTTYTVTVTNLGPSSVTGAVVKDTIPTGMTVTSVACAESPGQCTTENKPSSSALQSVDGHPLPTLAEGETYVFSLTATVNVDNDVNTIANVVTVTLPTGTTDPVSENNSATDTNSVPQADLAVTKSDGVTSIASGSSTTYTITVTNNGPSSVTGAVVTDTIPTGMTVTAVACKSGVTSNQCVTNPTKDVAKTWNEVLTSPGLTLPALPVDAVYAFTVTATIDVANNVTTISNPVSIALPAGTSDPVSSNNTDTDTNNVLRVADLQIVKTNSVDIVKAGTSTTYTITVTNFGPSSVTGAVVKDLAVVGLDVTAVACAMTTNIPVTEKCVVASPPTETALQSSGGFTLPGLASGNTYTFTVTAIVSAESTTVSNTVTVAPPAGTTDPVSGNNSSSDEDDVTEVELVELIVTRNNFVHWVKTGQPSTYTITVTNYGPDDVEGALLFDPVNADLDVTNVVCASPGGGQCAGRNLLPTDPSGVAATIASLQGSGLVLPYLAAGNSYTVKVTATVLRVASLSALSFIMSTNELTSQTYVAVPPCPCPPGVLEANPENNQAQEIDAVAPEQAKIADLELTKSNGVDTVEYGDDTTYTITVTNNGPDDIVNDPDTPDVDERTILQDVIPDWMKLASGWESTIIIECKYPSASKPTNETCDRAASSTYPSLASLQAGFRLPDMISGSTYTLTLRAPTPAFVPAPGPQTHTSISNTATLNMFGIIEANDPTGSMTPVLTATDTDDLKTPVADLVITKTDGAVAVDSGDPTTYTITVINNGPSSVPADGKTGNAVLRDVIPTWLTTPTIACAFSNATRPVTETCDESDPPTVVELSSAGGFTLPALDSGDTYTIELSGVVQSTAVSVSNTATVEAPDHIYEANLANNSTTDITYLVAAADLEITKTDGVSSIGRGSQTTYTIVVTNKGPDSVSGAILADPAVTGIDISSVACSPTPGACSTSPTLTQLRAGFALPTLAANQFFAIRVVATISSNATSVANVATVTSPLGILDPTTANNSATDSNAVNSTGNPPPPSGPNYNPIEWLTGGQISVTGSNIGDLILVGAIMLLVGSALVVRRRRGLAKRGAEHS
jgi:uncharacterized repeat protein (TIGR01451 family)